MERKITIFLMLFSALVFVRVFAFYALRPSVKEGNISFATIITSQPKTYNTYQTFSVNLPSGEPVFIRTNTDTEFNYSDNVKMVGSLKFKLLNNKRQILTMENSEISFDNSSKNPFLAVVNFICKQIPDTYNEYLPSDLSGLMLGIVIGTKANFSPQFSNRHCF